MDSSGSALYNTFWGRDERLHKKFFPMSMRPQSHDIIRTWAFYSILRSEQIEQSRPWNDIMVHGFIMAPDGTPMHSSVGNVIDPIPILKNYGADALRYFAASCALGIDHAFREPDVIRGRKLCNKIFNIGQFVGRFFEDVPADEPKDLRASDRWLISRYSQTVKIATDSLEVYQFDKAIKEVEQFVWHDLADNYIEMVKTRKDPAAKYTLYNVFLGCVKMIAPFMPHVTEDIYQEHFAKHDGAESIHLTTWPEQMFTDDDALKLGERLAETVAAIRAWKSEKKMPLNAELSKVEIIGEDAAVLEKARDDIIETLKIKELTIAAKADLSEEVVGVKPVHSKLGPAFKGQAKGIAVALSASSPKDIADQLRSGSVTLNLEDGSIVEVGEEYIGLEKRLMLDGKAVDTVQIGSVLVVSEV
jgi:valyl-tRNA synthetase